MAKAKKALPTVEHLAQKFPKYETVFLLDPGHGGIIDGEYQTKGKRSPKWPDGRQLFEGEFNRDVMNRVCKYMDIVGLKYEKVVEDQEDVPLSFRSGFINEYYYNVTKKCVVCSIHANAGGGTGFEIFTSPGLTDSDAYAEIMIMRMKEDFPELRLRADTDDGDHDKEAKFHMVTRTAPPAFLIECAFMDTLNPDCELMMSQEGRKRFAKSIFYGLVEIAEYIHKN